MGRGKKITHHTRLPGENRGPGYFKPLENTGFRLEFTPYLIRGRNDVDSTKPIFSQLQGTTEDKTVLTHRLQDDFCDIHHLEVDFTLSCIS
jgi:hypothetical protein